jgi:hypothetical protein
VGSDRPSGPAHERIDNQQAARLDEAPRALSPDWVESAKDPDIGKRLWRVSEELTGVQFDIPLDGGRSTARLGQELLGHNC